MARREYDYIKGSTALAPERKRKVRKLDKKYKHIQRRKKINNRNILLKNKRKNDRKYILTVAVVILGLGLITIYEDGKVYTMQKRVTEFNAQIKQTQEENEALKIDIMKFSSVSNIQQKANSKLAMFIPQKEETVKIDFSQNYFKDLETNVSGNGTNKTSLISKLINLIK